jgi:hypothetical protein
MNRSTPAKCWYHGSPLELARLPAGSSVTPNRRLAMVFSHNPTLVPAYDDGGIRHDGKQPGYLYGVSVQLGGDDLISHPHTSMAADEDCLTTRELPLTLLCAVPLVPEECFSQVEWAVLQRLMERGGL